MSAPRHRLAVAVVLTVVAVATIVGRVQPTLSGLRATAQKNDSYDALGRTIAAADSLDIDNGIVIAALELPRRATFAVLPPTRRAAARYSISPITVQGLYGYLQYVLLPRRMVAADQAQYLVCYSCATATVGGAVQWTWTGEAGLRIGRRVSQ